MHDADLKTSADGLHSFIGVLGETFSTDKIVLHSVDLGLDSTTAEPVDSNCAFSDIICFGVEYFLAVRLGSMFIGKAAAG